jgi:hypothetical protein
LLDSQPTVPSAPAKESKDSKEAKEAKETKDSKEAKETKDSKDVRDTRETRDTRDAREGKTEDVALVEALVNIEKMEREEQLQTLRRTRLAEYTKEGPNVYELFSVTVHMGGAFGGHYYVYIKSFEDGQWYNFNDSTVTRASEADIVHTYGDSAQARCAYLLMYRKLGLPQPALTDELVPKSLRDLIAVEQVEEEKAEVRRKEVANTLALTVNYNHGQTILPASKKDTLLKLKQAVWSLAQCLVDCCTLQP